MSQIQDKDADQRIDWLAKLLIVSISVVFGHLGVIAIWAQKITLGPIGKFGHTTHSEGTDASVMGLMLLSFSCFVFCLLPYKKSFNTKFNWCVLSVIAYIILTVIFFVLRPSL